MLLPHDARGPLIRYDEHQLAEWATLVAMKTRGPQKQVRATLGIARCEFKEVAAEH